MRRTDQLPFSGYLRQRYAEALISVSDSEKRPCWRWSQSAKLHRIYNGVADVASARVLTALDLYRFRRTSVPG